MERERFVGVMEPHNGREGMKSIELRRVSATGWGPMERHAKESKVLMPRPKAKRGKKRANRERLHRSLTATQWRAILAYWDGCCAYCGSAENITRDCILPISKDGIYAEYNVVPACGTCNRSKSSHNVFDWIKKKGYDGDAFERRLQLWWAKWI